MLKKNELCSCNDRPFYPAKVKAIVNGFERMISFKPGYRCEIDWNASNGGQSHGQHGMDLIFMLKGKAGVIQFVVYTGWMVDWKPYDKSYDKIDVYPADIGYHSYTPSYENHSSSGKCQWLENKECYYDGSSLNAERVFKIFVSQGEEALWNEMEQYYESWLKCKE